MRRVLGESALRAAVPSGQLSGPGSPGVCLAKGGCLLSRLSFPEGGKGRSWEPLNRPSFLPVASEAPLTSPAHLPRPLFSLDAPTLAPPACTLGPWTLLGLNARSLQPSSRFRRAGVRGGADGCCSR